LVKLQFCHILCVQRRTRSIYAFKQVLNLEIQAPSSTFSVLRIVPLSALLVVINSGFKT
jgi:hypothetical protein